MSPRSRSVDFTSQLVALFLARVRAAGHPVEPLIERFSLPPDAERLPEVRLPLQTFRDLSEAIAELLGDPLLGVHTSQQLPRGSYGLIEFITRTAGTVREALDALRRYSALLNERVVFSLDESGDDAIFRHRVPLDPLCCGRHSNEFFAARMVQMVGELTGVPLVPRRVWFAHPDPGPHPELFAAVNTGRIEFGANENGILFPASVLELPLKSHEPVLHGLLTEQARKVRDERATADLDLPDRTRLAIRRALGAGAPNAERVAMVLHMSSRTLQRHLAESGLTFQALVEEVRQTQARLYLADPSIGLGEVAFRLGYSDSRAFVRAFKRWTGQTPGAYRQREPTASDPRH